MQSFPFLLTHLLAYLPNLLQPQMLGRWQEGYTIQQVPTIVQPKAIVNSGYVITSYLRGGTGPHDEMAFALGLRPTRSTSHRADGCHARANMCAQDGQAGTGDGVDTTCGDLQAKLDLAIAEERYEDAAMLRDMIKGKRGSRTGPGPREQSSENVDEGNIDGESASALRERLRQREISRLRDIDPGSDNMGTPW
jgi:hypothetical protein